MAFSLLLTGLSRCQPPPWHKRVEISAGTARGYFAIGVEGISKAVNLGNLLRSAHAFGASFVFTIGADRAPWTPSPTRRGPLAPSPSTIGRIEECACRADAGLSASRLVDEAVELPPSPTRCRRLRAWS
jgi:hypothetical protein